MATLGTNLFAEVTGHTDVCLTDESGLAVLAKCDQAGEVQADTYQVGCLLIRTDNGTLYQNTGTVASPVWTAR